MNTTANLEKKKRNILIFYPGFLHYRDGIIKHLIKYGKHKYIFAGDRKGYNNIKPYHFPDNAPFVHLPWYKIGPFYFNRGWLKLLRTKNFDGAIVHASPYWLSIILASLYLRIKGKPVYNWTHGILTDHKSLKNRIYALYYKLFFDGLLLYGNISKGNLKAFGHKEANLKVIYNSLDYHHQIQYRDTLSEQERKVIRRQNFDNPENFQLLFIGRLTKQKKLDILIDALEILRNEGHNVNLLLVGSGEEERILREKVDQKKLNSAVCFYGANYEEHLNYKLIAASDCCVAPGEIGLTAMHSLMYGVPVISHDDANSQMPEFEAIIPGLNGMLYKKNDIYDLAKRIRDVEDFKLDRESQKLKEDCYSVIDRYYNPDYQLKLIDGLF